jgi:dihydrofolate synthase/folylpolyglutamate synthase
MEAFGNPHEKFASLHIAGTNGKGSVAAIAESILRHGGWTTGIFVSPHLRKIEERIRVNGREISPRRFASLASQIRLKEAALLRKKQIDHPLTFFEFVTACAFLHFAQAGVDLAVVEVGLGGRLDATNILLPQCTVITGVSYDHQALLGNTLAKIAREKAGIVKTGVPIVSGCVVPEARDVIRKHARRLAAPLVEIDRECTIECTGQRDGRYSMNLKTPSNVYERLHLSLAGKFQLRNAAMAIAAVERLTSFPVTASAVRHGVAKTQWPGRMESYRAARWTLLDGAHNPEAAKILREHLRTLNASEFHFVFGGMLDKDLGKMGAILFPMARSIHLGPIDNPRAASPRAIVALNAKFQNRMRVHASAAGALRGAWRECPSDGCVVITGSLYLLGELLPFVRKSTESQPGRYRSRF